MKFTTMVQLLALGATTVLAAPSDTAAEECGAAGVNNVDLSNLPEGVDPSQVRKCKEHPGGSLSEALEKRDCFHDAQFGCHKGYCWKQCGISGSGQWCWTAHNSGWGEWIGCSEVSQCNIAQECGIGEDCEDCGCSC